ncbi:hypothetical protein ACTJKN_02550 [Pedobacter sp. 22163]|uniref:hypothetical protein n=1 Tax=Pedobacter sp. 22163 TaxID=3453883 RepID=UPI003F86F796
MFGLFKRKKIQSWEVELLENTLKALPQDFKVYVEQIKLGLLKAVSIGNPSIPGYIGFTRDAEIYNAINDAKGRDFEVYGILVYDCISNSYLEYSIFFSFGTVDGYAIKNQGKFKIDTTKIDVSHMRIKFRDNIDFAKLKKILSPKELEFVNANDVYTVNLDNKEYFHLLDIADGDFYGIDLEKNLYRITHDPHRIEKVDIGVIDIFEGGQ